MKKIIAREFLFVLGFGVLVGLTYCTLLLMKYTKQLKVEELSRQSNLLTDFQPNKYYYSFYEGDSSVYDDFKELYFDLRSYGITNVDETEFDIFAKFNCSAYDSKNERMNEDLYQLMKDGAFSNKEEFSDFISGATQKEIYSLVIEGAFESFEEFESIFYDVKKIINPELVRNLYAKYSPDTDVESKMAYIQEVYKNNQDEFVRNFYSKYAPNTDIDSKIEYINKSYPFKKKEDSEVTSQTADTASPAQQVEEESTSVESFTQHSDMDEKDLKALFSSIPQGMFTNEQELKDLIESEGVGVLYESMPQGMFSSKEEFESTFFSAINTRISTFQYNQLSDFYTSAKIKLNNEINSVRRKNPFEYFGILVLSLFSLVFLLRYLIYSTLWSVKQLKN